MPSRPLFKAYTHVDPFVPIPAEMQGKAPAPAKPKALNTNTSDVLAASVGAAVQHLFDVQVWNWTLVAMGQMPACLFGAVSQNGFGCPMIESAECKFNPRTHRWPAVCKANISACKKSWQARDDAGAPCVRVLAHLNVSLLLMTLCACMVFPPQAICLGPLPS
jgi:hypothetical protein